MANHEYYSVSVHSMLEMFWSKCRVFGALRFTLYALRSTLYALRSTLYALRFTLYALRSTQWIVLWIGDLVSSALYFTECLHCSSL